jgi:tetratricopeptide (TPR) repeat protein
VIALLVLALALNARDSYNQGNRLYAAKDYAGAATAYREALTTGHDPRVHYNLGNALFKSGKIGEAILNYRRAYALAPRDPDTRGNLAFARAYRLDKFSSSANPLARALDRTFHWLSRRESSLWSALLVAVTGLALAGWIVWRRTALGWASVGLGAAAAYCLVTAQVWSAEVSAQPAVVVVPEVSASSAPSEEAKQILLLHDGTEVRIRESRGDYDLVQIPGGNGGWIPKSAIERVYEASPRP